MALKALFEGLVVDTDDQPVGVAVIGGEAHYVVNDAGFKFHHPAEPIDREVLRLFGEQIHANRSAVTEGAMKMIGQEDLFTKAAIDASLNNLEANFNQLIANGLPEGARAYMGMLGFKVVINHHGEVVDIQQPGAPDDEA